METSKNTKTNLENFIKDPDNNEISNEALEEIYTVGVYHGLFSERNSGVDDRQNSVYGFLDTLKCLVK